MQFSDIPRMSLFFLTGSVTPLQEIQQHILSPTDLMNLPVLLCTKVRDICIPYWLMHRKGLTKYRWVNLHIWNKNVVQQKVWGVPESLAPVTSQKLSEWVQRQHQITSRTSAPCSELKVVLLLDWLPTKAWESNLSSLFYPKWKDNRFMLFQKH